MQTLVIASRNAHKADEIRAILGDQFMYLDLNAFPDAPKVVEDAASFAGNATKKAVELASWLGRRGKKEELLVLADDSGLEVDALNGAPGVHSARFAAMDMGKDGNSTDGENNAKLLRLLAAVPVGKRTARFRCVLALAPVVVPEQGLSSPVCAANELELLTRTFDGSCEGTIGYSPRGLGGFGYDPLFVPIGFQESFAELGEDVKNSMSHRSKALEKLKTELARRGL